MHLRLELFLSAVCLSVLTGCGGVSISSGPVSSPPLPGSFTISGNVEGNQTAIAGSSVQLYAAGITGNGSSPVALWANPAVTDTSGAFSVPVTYTCPSAGSTLYLTATGGSVGANAPDNSAIFFMAPVGVCGSTTSANTMVVVNEVTTAASVWALSPFLSPGGKLGSTSTNQLGLTNAMTNAANLVNPSTGTAQGAKLPSNVTIATAKLNTLANALASCVALKPATACETLFASATTAGAVPDNTIDAALNIVRNPQMNVAAVYGLSTTDAVYQPALSSAPPDWLLYNTISGGGLNSPQALSIDSAGDAWVTSYFGVVSEFEPDGAAKFSSGITGYGINQSYGMTLDASDNVWVSNEQTAMNSGSGDVTKLSSSGASLSGASGFASGSVYFPLGIAADSNQTIWVANYGNYSITLLDSNGNVLSGSGFGIGSVEYPVAIAVDANHNAWVANSVTGAGFVTRISSDGSKVANFACCNDSAGIAVDSTNNVWVTNFSGDSISLLAGASSDTPSMSIFTGGGLDYPNGIAIDGAGTVWVTNYRGNSLSIVAGAAQASSSAVLSGTGLGSDGGLGEPFAVAIDASGDVWVSNASRNTVTEFLGAAAPVKTPLIGPVQTP